MNQFVEYDNEELEQDTISNWIDHHPVEANNDLGEDICYAVGEVFNYE